MGRLFLVAGIAMLVASGSLVAKSNHSGRGQAKPAASVSVSIPLTLAEGCPPGLKNKNVPCLPPGRYKKQFEIGQKVPAGYKGLIRYDALPHDLRMGYGGALDPDARYVYDQHFIYRVDPATLVVRQILRSLP
jgi:hypothetical protein